MTDQATGRRVSHPAAYAYTRLCQPPMGTRVAAAVANGEKRTRSVIGFLTNQASTWSCSSIRSVDAISSLLRNAEWELAGRLHEHRRPRPPSQHQGA